MKVLPTREGFVEDATFLRTSDIHYSYQYLNQSHSLPYAYIISCEDKSFTLLIPIFHRSQMCDPITKLAVPVCLKEHTHDFRVLTRSQ